MMNVAESLLHGLAAYGAGEIFGIPGDFALPFFNAPRPSFRCGTEAPLLLGLDSFSHLGTFGLNERKMFL